MRVTLKLPAVALAFTVIAGCADTPSSPSAADRSTVTLTTADGTMELKRPKVDVTDWVDESITLPPGLATPDVMEGIGPGSAIVITIPNEGRFGCTANFVWQSGGKLYLGAAGHCFIPETLKATHGEGADYDASGVTVQVCVEDCAGNFRTDLLTGKMMNLGKVAYARQTDPTGTEPVGNDFGVVEIPSELHEFVRPAMPVWGGPKGVTKLEQGALACHYGNGVGVGETFPTKGRVGVGGGSDADFWMGDFAGAFGDSGSGLVGCVTQPDGVIAGTGAIGILTHLGVSACPCDVNFKNLKIKANHGVIFGTTVARAIIMGKEAGLNLKLVEPAS